MHADSVGRYQISGVLANGIGSRSLAARTVTIEVDLRRSSPNAATPAQSLKREDLDLEETLSQDEELPDEVLHADCSGSTARIHAFICLQILIC